MGPHAQALTAHASFSVESFDEIDPHEHGGAALGHARLAKTFGGDIVGTSRVDMLHVIAAGGGARAYVATEELDVTVDGRAGTFVLLHQATQGGPADGASWTIAPGSGSGELEGIAGTATIDGSAHTMTLEYTLAQEA